MKLRPKKVIIITGFLGSGKTTLLNAILQHQKQKRFAIIENEIGEIGIDGDLIIKNQDSFTALNNGCICCSLNHNFIDTLRELSRRNDWDELIIEATGIANPGGIISPFKQLPWLQKYFQLPEVICIVDAHNIDEQLNISDTTASQLAYSEKVYVNKTDLVSGIKIKEIQKTILRLNPFAHLYTGNKNNIPLAQLLQKKESLRPILTFTGNNITIKSQHPYFDAVALEYHSEFNENKLFTRLYTFLAVQSYNVYRFKGIFYTAEKQQKMIIQSVMKSLFIEEGELWAENEEKVSRFVFIGKDLKEKGFDKMLKSCVQ